jgi:DNA polymerase-3 subunit delta
VAKKNEQPKEDNLQVLKSAIRSGAPDRFYIFYGEEVFLLHHYFEQLKKLLLDDLTESFNFHKLTQETFDFQTFADSVEAMPMMAEHTLVTVSDLDIFKLDESGRNALAEILSDFPDYCVLIFLYDTIAYKRDGKMKKLCTVLDQFVQEVEFCEQERAALIKWVRRRVLATGHDIDTATVDHLLFTCGTLMTDLVPEIGKIASYAKGQNITIADINAVADPILDAQVFDMTRRITEGKYDDAARILGELLRMQEEPIMILAVIGKELRRLYTARMALDSGKDKQWLKQLWGMKSDYPADLLLKAARKVDHAWCSRAVQQCQVLDRRMKSEKGMDNEAELKLFLMELAGSR